MAFGYKILRSFLFLLDAERAHHITVSGLRVLSKLGLAGLAGKKPPKVEPLRVMGLEFPNRVGLAAGMDKEGTCIDGFGALGFGFVEVGTATPRPQPGNAKPRLFRLKEHDAIINRMGFNNPGIKAVVENVRSQNKFQGIIGINIGKNFDTPNEKAVDDYLACFHEAWDAADYIAVNLSSPNTAGLRELQEAESCGALVSRLKQEQAILSEKTGRYVPLAVKIAPDLEEAQITALAKIFAQLEVDAVIATNTTISREPVAGHPLAGEKGGLSGKPVREMADIVIRTLKRELGDAIPIIGVGGIMSGTDAQAKIDAGASLVQIYTGLVYRGPDLIVECVSSPPPTS